jgi:hypothetical protein
MLSAKAEQAYRRSDALEKRRLLMEAWAAYCEPKNSVNVVQMRKSYLEPSSSTWLPLGTITGEKKIRERPSSDILVRKKLIVVFWFKGNRPLDEIDRNQQRMALLGCALTCCRTPLEKAGAQPGQL